jgi:hypothetical protein
LSDRQASREEFAIERTAEIIKIFAKTEPLSKRLNNHNCGVRMKLSGR